MSGTSGDESSEDMSRQLARDASAVLASPKLSPLQILARGALVIILLYLIFWVVIPQFADYDEAWTAITSLTTVGLILMVGLTLSIELEKSAAPVIGAGCALWLRRTFRRQRASAATTG